MTYKPIAEAPKDKGWLIGWHEDWSNPLPILWDERDRSPMEFLCGSWMYVDTSEGYDEIYLRACEPTHFTYMLVPEIWLPFPEFRPKANEIVNVWVEDSQKEIYYINDVFLNDDCVNYEYKGEEKARPDLKVTSFLSKYPRQFKI